MCRHRPSPPPPGRTAGGRSGPVSTTVDATVSDTAVPIADDIVRLLAQEPHWPEREALEALAQGLLRRAPLELLQARVARGAARRDPGPARVRRCPRDPVAVRVQDGPRRLDGARGQHCRLAVPGRHRARRRSRPRALDADLLLHPVLGIEPDRRRLDRSHRHGARQRPTRESVMRVELVERLDAEQCARAGCRGHTLAAASCGSRCGPRRRCRRGRPH